MPRVVDDALPSPAQSCEVDMLRPACLYVCPCVNDNSERVAVGWSADFTLQESAPHGRGRTCIAQRRKVQKTVSEEVARRTDRSVD